MSDETDVETFNELSPGDKVTFHGWPVEPLIVVTVSDESVRIVQQESEAISELVLEDGDILHHPPEDIDDEELEDWQNPYHVLDLEIVN